MTSKHLLACLFCVCSCAKQEVFITPSAVQLDSEGEQWARQTLAAMTPEEKVGQLLMVRANVAFYNVKDPAWAELNQAVRKYHVGSMLLSVPNDTGTSARSLPFEAAFVTNQLQHESKVPLLFAADFERGLSMRFAGTTSFPHTMAFAAAGKLDYVRDFARVVARESRAIGVHLNFFPIADVSSNPANPIINIRSFSENPERVSEFVAAYVKEAQKAGLLTTAKHFPGHGNEDSDSHLGVARILSDAAHIEAVELVPFRGAIAAGVGAIMMAHVTVPALEPAADRVATTSHLITSDLLRERLGFNGLVVTDALQMNAIADLYPDGRAGVEALKAGNDVLLLPRDLQVTANAVMQAAETGELSWPQIDAAVMRVLLSKASVGLHRSKTVDISQLPQLLSQPADAVLSQQIADDAVTLIRDSQTVLPLTVGKVVVSTGHFDAPAAPDNDLLVVLLVDNVQDEPGRIFAREVHERRPGARMIFVDPNLVSGMTPEILAAADMARAIVVAAVITPTAGKVVKVEGNLTNAVSLDDASAALLNKLLAGTGDKVVLISLGNPYLAMDFPNIGTYLCTFSHAPPSQRSAVKALFAEIDVGGHLPVTIPKIAPYGAGLFRAKR
ncbi:MAG: hypothetical protein A2341_12005 [Deltaproteobacteria bacterium RIFOXYB12_FULL_58_9]|nr:MAG: hypothetical protein A2341_12005 [Deltaproteobacteria bacterium RIFOXYB12_FULL_58_9]